MSLYLSETSGSFTGGRSGAVEPFPDPWSDIASQAMPRSTRHAQAWNQFLATAHGVLRQALSRVVAYFVTDVDVQGRAGDDEKKKWLDYLNDTLGIQRILSEIGIDFLVDGESFSSVVQAFKRRLRCPGCVKQPRGRQRGMPLTLPLETIVETPAFDFTWSNYSFHAACVSCGFRGDWGRPIDQPGTEEDVAVTRWPVQEIDVEYAPVTQVKRYLWRVAPDLTTQIRRGVPHQLLHTPWEIIDAIRDDKYFRFHKDAICHVDESTLSGLKTQGRGISRILSNFRQAWYCQILQRFNEAIAQDYIVPLRVISPETRAGADPLASDPIVNVDLSGWERRIHAMLRRHRRDPATWNVSPIPLKYQVVGGEAKNLAPVELIKYGTETLLAGIGVPLELMQANLTVQAAPMAMRLFESNWAGFVFVLNRFLNFVARRVSELLNWEPVKLRLRRPRHVDNVERSQLLIQLAMGQVISKGEALAALDVDYAEQVRKMLDENRFQYREQKEFEDDIGTQEAGRQVAAGPPPGAQPGQPGQPGEDPAAAGPPGAAQSVVANVQPAGTTPVNPQELMAQAHTIASQLLALPDSQRTSELITLKKTNETLHGLVRAALEQIRSSARSTGQQQVLQQQFGQQPG